MVKKAAIFIFGLTLLSALSVSAAMGTYGTSGHMGCNVTAMNHTGHMAATNSGNGNMHQYMHGSKSMHHNSANSQMIDSKTAQEKMRVYMDNQSASGYQLKNFRDDGSYFKAEVMTPRGELLNGIVVNKKNGAVYFTKK